MKKSLLFLLPLLAMMFSIVSCSNDDDDATMSSSLVGRWELNNTAFVFNSDKTGYRETEHDDVRRSNFTWIQTPINLILNYDGSGGMTPATYTYFYKLMDNVLTIFYSDYEFMGAYVKVYNTGNNNNNGTTTGTISGHAWVDLGLPSGLKWATCNVGADSPEEYGAYYAWGETTTKSDYDRGTYKWCKGSSETVTKYCTDRYYGTVDNKKTLELSDDAARANWGGSWRMPTEKEFQELIDNCTWYWRTLNGKNGYKVASKKNGNSIFLPAAGYRNGTSLNRKGSLGYYWSSTLDEIDPGDAYGLDFGSGLPGTDWDYRYFGRSVRPVSE